MKDPLSPQKILTKKQYLQLQKSRIWGTPKNEPLILDIDI